MAAPTDIIPTQLTLTIDNDNNSAQAFIQRGELNSRGRDIDQMIRQYFKHCRVDPDEEVNLIMMTGGRWMVGPDKLKHFYERVLPGLRDKLFSLVEKPHPQGKLIFDWDSDAVVLNTSVIGKVIAEVVHDVYQADDEPYWPSVYVSKSSARPLHKVHFIVTSHVCVKADRLVITLMVRQRLIEHGYREMAERVDLKMTSLRLRFATKVEVGTRRYQPEKGMYGPFEVCYSPLGETTHSLPLFHFSALSFKEPVSVPTARGLELMEEMRRLAESGPLVGRMRMQLRSSDSMEGGLVISTEQRVRVLEWARTSPLLDPLRDDFAVGRWWGSCMLRLNRLRPGYCPADPSGERHHDHQSAYVIFNADLSRYRLNCHCREFEPRLLWEDPRRVRVVVDSADEEDAGDAEEEEERSEESGDSEDSDSHGANQQARKKPRSQPTRARELKRLLQVSERLAMNEPTNLTRVSQYVADELESRRLPM